MKTTIILNLILLNMFLTMKPIKENIMKKYDKHYEQTKLEKTK